MAVSGRAGRSPAITFKITGASRLRSKNGGRPVCNWKQVSTIRPVQLSGLASRQTHANAYTSLAGVRTHRSHPKALGCINSGASHRVLPAWLVEEVSLVEDAAMTLVSPKSARHAFSSSETSIFVPRKSPWTIFIECR
jgi:hypothetical protein